MRRPSLVPVALATALLAGSACDGVAPERAAGTDVVVLDPAAPRPSPTARVTPAASPSPDGKAVAPSPDPAPQLRFTLSPVLAFPAGGDALPVRAAFDAGGLVVGGEAGRWSRAESRDGAVALVPLAGPLPDADVGAAVVGDVHPASAQSFWWSGPGAVGEIAHGATWPPREDDYLWKLPLPGDAPEARSRFLGAHGDGLVVLRGTTLVALTRAGSKASIHEIALSEDERADILSAGVAAGRLWIARPGTLTVVTLEGLAVDAAEKRPATSYELSFPGVSGKPRALVFVPREGAAFPEGASVVWMSDEGIHGTADVVTAVTGVAPPPPPAPPSWEQVSSTAVAACAGCHGAQGAGGFRNAQTEASWTGTRRARLVEVLEGGTMPPAGTPAATGLTPEAREKLIAWLKSL